jgi:hypothetical protein
MDQTRTALLALSAFLVLVAVALQAGAVPLLGAAGGAAGASDLPRPGLGIASLALLDGLLLYAFLLLLVEQVGPLRPVLARVQWLVTLVLMLLGLLGTIVLLLLTFAQLVLMVSLLLAVPFGTIAYLAAWGDFATGAAKAVLGLVMALKLAALVIGVIAFPTLPKSKGLLLLALTSLLATFLLGFLHAFPPRILASITDAIGALIAGILAALWMLFFLIGTIGPGIKAIRSLAPR